jgi:hypothetical protein
MMLKYVFKGCFDYQWEEIGDSGLIVGVDDNDNDPYVIKSPTKEQVAEMIGKPQYIGTGLTATLIGEVIAS